MPLGNDDRPECGQRGVGLLEHGDIVGPEEVGHGDEDTGTTAGEDDGRLGALEARVDGHQDGAGSEQAERRHRPFDTVAAPDGHPVARIHPHGDERGTELPGLLGQLGVGEGRRTIAYGQQVCELGGRAVDHGRDGGPGRWNQP